MEHRHHDPYEWDEEDPWEGVRLTKEAISARTTLLLYTALLTAPFVALIGCGGYFAGLRPHEVLGASCYQAMVSSVIFFDTLRNAAHECFSEAQSAGLVTCIKGIPIVDPAYPHRRLASLSFAIGGRPAQKRS
ncbi:hypothetical protein [Geomonas sp.]|uniref:hypothetical protein n=1 Tax=Geomonas sp. TaxID=2651584 RepID=UPI002B466B1D|nr:hypothetical protein [Geomonas sp.]HJV36066.1 hypothetical protein [Geomonas sp.]